MMYNTVHYLLFTKEPNLLSLLQHYNYKEKVFRYILSRVDVGQITYKYHWTHYCLYKEVHKMTGNSSAVGGASSGVHSPTVKKALRDS